METEKTLEKNDISKCDSLESLLVLLVSFIVNVSFLLSIRCYEQLLEYIYVTPDGMLPRFSVVIQQD